VPVKRSDIFAGVLLAAIFGAALWEAWSFQYGTEFAPGPGFAPVWLSAIGIVLSVLVTVGACRALGRAEPSELHRGSEASDRVGLLRVAATLGGLIAMVALVGVLGLVLSVLVFLLFLTLVVQRLSPAVALGASLGTVTFVYLVFVRFLEVPIPGGPLGF
jgi:putative tricarboxylic transport membrane protein